MALDAAQPSSLALQLMVALGGRTEHAQLVSRLGELTDSERRLDFLFALGFSGNVSLILDPLLGALSAAPPKRSWRRNRWVLSSAFYRLKMRSPRPLHSQTTGWHAFTGQDDPEAQASLPPLEEDDLKRPRGAARGIAPASQRASHHGVLHGSARSLPAGAARALRRAVRCSATRNHSRNVSAAMASRSCVGPWSAQPRRAVARHVGAHRADSVSNRRKSAPLDSTASRSSEHAHSGTVVGCTEPA